MKGDLSIIDVNAWLGQWPFQYFRDETAALLEKRLAAEGVTRALVGSPEGAFNPDCLETNRVLLRRIGGSRMLLPVLAVDPTKGDWQDILQLARDAAAPAVRLFPGYHCYELEAAPARELVEHVAKAGGMALFVQIRMEDERTHHPLCRIPPVKIESIVDLARQFPGLRIVAQCPYYHEAVELAKGPANLSFDISHVETLRTLLSLTQQVPVDRVLYGTHVPFLQSRAALMKLDAPYVTPEVRAAVGAENARALFGASLSGRIIAHGTRARVVSNRKPAKAVTAARKPAKKAARKTAARRKRSS
jgi:hypothetical protein